jgi:hypothetical protein
LIWVYCKTTDKPKEVGQYICKSNFSHEDNHTESKVMKDENEEDCWLIKTNPHNETSAMIYNIGKEVIAVEIDDDCAINVIEPLMKKYGFANVKWLLTK